MCNRLRSSVDRSLGGLRTGRLSGGHQHTADLSDLAAAGHHGRPAAVAAGAAGRGGGRLCGRGGVGGAGSQGLVLCGSLVHALDDVIGLVQLLLQALHLFGLLRKCRLQMRYLRLQRFLPLGDHGLARALGLGPTIRVRSPWVVAVAVVQRVGRRVLHLGRAALFHFYILLAFGDGGGDAADGLAQDVIGWPLALLGLRPVPGGRAGLGR